MQHIVVSGKVQGVSYRDFAVRNAKALGITGWVRNLRDGHVEILATREEGALDSLIERCREGPPLARVDAVDAAAGDKGFTKRFTA